MRVKLITLSFSPSLGRFSDSELEAFAAGREIIAVREHFFEADGVAHFLTAGLASLRPGRPRLRRADGAAAPGFARALRGRRGTCSGTD